MIIKVINYFCGLPLGTQDYWRPFRERLKD